MLLTPPVRGPAPRLVHIQHLDHEQHQQAANGVEQVYLQREEIGTVRLCRYACQEADRLQPGQQNDGGKDGQQE